MGGCKTLPTLNFVHAETCKLGERVFTNPRRPLQRHNDVKLRHWVNHILPRCWIWWEHDGLLCEYIILCNCGGRIIWAVLKFYKGRKEAEKRLLWIGLIRFKQQAEVFVSLKNIILRPRWLFWLENIVWKNFKLAILSILFLIQSVKHFERNALQSWAYFRGWVRLLGSKNFSMQGFKTIKRYIYEGLNGVNR